MRYPIVAGSLALALTACGGGGGGSGSSAAAPLPTIVPTAAPTATPAPTPSPTPVPVTNAAAPVFQLDDAPGAVYGDPATFSIAGASASTPIDGIACTRPGTLQTHIHARVSVFVNGREIAVPSGVGIYHPKVIAAPYQVDADPSDPASCVYDVHVHAGEGIVHIESAQANAQYSLGAFLDIWGMTYSSAGFGPYAGTPRLFDTDESTGAAGAHPVTELVGTDPHAVTLRSRHDYTIEIGPTWTLTPSDVFTF